MKKSRTEKLKLVYTIAYTFLKVLTSLYFARPFLYTIYRCDPTPDVIGASPGACYFYPKLAIPLVGLLIFTFTKWPLIGGLITFFSGHFLYFPGVYTFSYGIYTSTYPGSMYTFLPDHGGMVFIHFELFFVMAWSILEQIVRGRRN